MRTTQSITRKKESFSQAITGTALQNLIKKSVPDARAAARFTGALISVVAKNPKLQKVNPATVVACALRGEGAGLQIERDYHVVPFGNTAQYIVGYKGLLSLMMATGEVQDANCIPVYSGELLGRNKKTKRQEFDFSIYENEEEEQKHELLGYYFYIEKKDGMFHREYMSIQEIISHAERYSKSFNRKTYEKIVNGELTGSDLEEAKSKSLWYTQAETMMKKTVIRKLLNSGYVRLANDAGLREQIQYDNETNDALLDAEFEILNEKEQISAEDKASELINGKEEQEQKSSENAEDDFFVGSEEE